MAKSKGNELLAGIFVVLCLAAALGVVLWLGASEVLKSGGQTAYFYIPSSEGPAGLQEGGDVLFGDSFIGKIVKIDIYPQQGRCVYQVRVDRRDIVLHSDCAAGIVSPVIGSARLAIRNPGVAATLADAEHPIPLTGGLNLAMTNLEVATNRLRDISEKLTDEFDERRPQSILSKIRSMADDMKSATSDVATVTKRVVQQMDPNQGTTLLGHLVAVAGHLDFQTDAAKKDSLLGKVHKSADDVNAMTADARPKLEKTMTAVQELAERINGYSKKELGELLAKLSKAGDDIQAATKNLSDMTADAKTVVASVSGGKIREMLDNFVLVSEDLKATARDVRRNPWRLLHQPTDKELDSANVYDAARAFMQGAEQLDIAVRQLADLSKAQAAQQAIDPAQVKEIRDHLQATFEHFRKVEQGLWKELEKK